MCVCGCVFVCVCVLKRVCVVLCAGSAVDVPDLVEDLRAVEEAYNRWVRDTGAKGEYAELLPWLLDKASHCSRSHTIAHC